MTEDIQFLPDNYWAQEAKRTISYQYYSGKSDLAIHVNFYWGVGDYDTSNDGSWDPNDLGDLSWDSSFDIT